VLAARRALREQAPAPTAAADELLERAVERIPLSGRGHARVARVARTIAGLAASDAVEVEHVAEALSYRTPSELAE
jgi:magnesium chelatase family protein